MKSRTIDLSYHFSSLSPAATSTTTAETQGAKAKSRSLSPPPLQQSNQHQDQRPGTIRQRTWSVSEATASREEQRNEGEAWARATPGGDTHNHGSKERGHEGDGTCKGTGCLPLLSPRSTAVGADRQCSGGGQGGNRSGRNKRHDVSCGSDSSLFPPQSLGSNERAHGGDGAGGGERDRDRHHRGHREEGKSSRESGGGGGDDGGVGSGSPRYSASMSPSGSHPSSSGRAGWGEQRGGSWQGWGGSWEGKERDEKDDHRLPPSPRGSFPRDKNRGNAEGRGGDGKEEDGGSSGRQSPSSSSRARKSSSEGFKLPQSPSG